MSNVNSIERYIGHTVEVIYLDREGRFTQRVITVHGVEGAWIRVFCHTRGQPRRFRADHILAVRSMPQPRLYRSATAGRHSAAAVKRTAG